jgi:hypothetical protein
MREKSFVCSVRQKIMKHNLTPEQIVIICLGLFIGGLWLYSIVESLKEKHYTKGYKHGYNRAKWIYSERNNGGSGRYVR